MNPRNEALFPRRGVPSLTPNAPLDLRQQAISDDGPFTSATRMQAPEGGPVSASQTYVTLWCHGPCTQQALNKCYLSR